MLGEAPTPLSASPFGTTMRSLGPTAIALGATWPTTGLCPGMRRGRETYSGSPRNGIPYGATRAIAVRLATLAGRADFTEIVVYRSLAGGWAQWLDGDLGYTIAVRGNTFRETGGDAGRLTGIFTGPNHEGAAGTLERSDLTAAFGAARDAR